MTPSMRDWNPPLWRRNQALYNAGLAGRGPEEVFKESQVLSGPALTCRKQSTPGRSSCCEAGHEQEVQAAKLPSLHLFQRTAQARSVGMAYVLHQLSARAGWGLFTLQFDKAFYHPSTKE